MDAPLPFLPQITHTNFVTTTNTSGWKLYSGNYTAHGGEHYLIIGNFKSDANTRKILAYDSLGTVRATYIYIDDVSLSEEDPDQKVLINVYPNPFINQLTVKVNNNLHNEFILYDTTARKIVREEFTGVITLNTSALAEAIYLYEVRNEFGLLHTGKVVRQ